MSLHRRGFLKQGLLALSALPFLGGALNTLAMSSAQANEKSKGKGTKDIPLPPGASAAPATDPVVMAVGYQPNAKDVDPAKYPQRKKPEAKTQSCKNCAFYTAQNEGWGKCQIIPSGLVNAQGWCGSYQKKP